MAEERGRERGKEREEEREEKKERKREKRERERDLYGVGRKKFLREHAVFCLPVFIPGNIYFPHLASS